MTVRPEMVNGFGVCHGGIAFSLADSALAFACNTHGRVTVSIENSHHAIRRRSSAGDVLTATAARGERGVGPAGVLSVDGAQPARRAVGLFRGTVYRTSRARIFDGQDDVMT